MADIVYNVVTTHTIHTEVSAMSSYTHFTTAERDCLQDYLDKGLSMRKIADKLGRSPSSISREINRNRSRTRSKHKSNKYWYHHWRATVLAITRQQNHCRRALPEGSEIRDYVIEKLKLFWSPEQIAARWKLEHGGSGVSCSTIYRYLKSHQLGDLKPQNCLRRRGKNKNYVHRNSCNVIHPDRIIPEWPDAITQRIRIGDWEGDTVYGGVGKGLIVTLVDRKSRFLCAGLIPSRDAEVTRKEIGRLLRGLPVTSISLDNGSEFAQFRELEADVDAPVYFAEPHKPWQRGTNENHNDILRYFFPKGFDFRSIDDTILQAVVTSINNRPRKCLGWRSPFEVFFSVALA